MRITGKRRPIRLDLKRSIRTRGRLRASLSSNEQTEVSVQDDQLGWCVGVFTGQCELDLCYQEEYDLSFVSDGEVFMADLQADQAVELGDVEMYVSYDRPPILSAEMRAIQTLQRQNAIEREGLMSQMRFMAEQLAKEQRDEDAVIDTSDEPTRQEADARKPAAQAGSKNPARGKRAPKGRLVPDDDGAQEEPADVQPADDDDGEGGV